jgi:hypothetical protein
MRFTLPNAIGDNLYPYLNYIPVNVAGGISFREENEAGMVYVNNMITLDV